MLYRRKIVFLIVIVTFSLILPIIFRNNFSIDADLNQGAHSDQFWIDNQGYVDQIIYKVISNEEMLIQSLRTGEIHIVGQYVNVDQLTPSDYNDQNIVISQTRARGFGQITHNSQKFPTSLRSLRQGFAYALDKVDLQQRALGGASFIADSPIVGALGVWSCEYEFSLVPCSPTYENYYDPNTTKANTTVLSTGFYDWDNNGFREFFNGTVYNNGSLIWNGSAVAQSNTIEFTSGYPNARWDGYTFLGEDNIRRNFREVNNLLNGSTLSPNSAGSALLAPPLQNTTDWLKVELTITGSARSAIIDKSITIASEAYYSMGIKVYAEFVTYPALLSILVTGDYSNILYEYDDIPIGPSVLNRFISNSLSNQRSSRWYNSSFDFLWNVIDTNSNIDTVLEASFDAQEIFWQEQPITILYNPELFSMYRNDKFEGFVTVPGQGAYTRESAIKVHQKNTAENWQIYPNYPNGGTLVYGIQNPMDSLNSMDSNSYNTKQILGTVEEKLFYRNPVNLEFLSSGLATSWVKESPYTDGDLNNCPNKLCIVNGSRFSFTLVPNATWHNGEQFTSKDVKFSFEVLKSNSSPVYVDLLQSIPTKRIELPSNNSIIIYSNSSGLFEFANLGIPIYQKKYWENFSDAVNHANPLPKGTGPYMWVSSSPGEFYLQIKYDDHYRRPTKDSFLKYFTIPAGVSSEPTSQQQLLPNEPRMLHVESGTNTIKLSWVKPISEGSAPITEYRIYRSKNEFLNYNQLATLIIETNTPLYYEDTNVEPGKTYYYYITAMNSYGESIRSGIKRGSLEEETTSSTTSKTNSIISTNGFEFFKIGMIIIPAIVVGKKRLQSKNKEKSQNK